MNTSDHVRIGVGNEHTAAITLERGWSLGFRVAPCASVKEPTGDPRISAHTSAGDEEFLLFESLPKKLLTLNSTHFTPISCEP